MVSTISIVCFALLGLSVGNVASSDDDACASWDNTIVDLVFDPAKSQITQAKADYLKPQAIDMNLGWGIKVKTGDWSVGNLTNFDLVHLPGAKAASYMCQYENSISLSVDLQFNEITVNLDDFLVSLPLLPKIGNTATVITNHGNALSFNVSVDTSGDKCVATFNSLDIRSLGTTHLEFKSGFFNKIYQFIFNMFSNLIAKLLIHFGALNPLTAFAKSMASQQSATICQMLNPLGSD